MKTTIAQACLCALLLSVGIYLVVTTRKPQDPYDDAE